MKPIIVMSVLLLLWLVLTLVARSMTPPAQVIKKPSLKAHIVVLQVGPDGPELVKWPDIEVSEGSGANIDFKWPVHTMRIVFDTTETK